MWDVSKRIVLWLRYIFWYIFVTDYFFSRLFDQMVHLLKNADTFFPQTLSKHHVSYSMDKNKISQLWKETKFTFRVTQVADQHQMSPSIITTTLLLSGETCPLSSIISLLAVKTRQRTLALGGMSFPVSHV